MKKKYLILLSIFFYFSLVSAFDFTVNVDSTPTPTPYEGETVSLGASVIPSVEYGCKLICKWATADFGENLINGGQSIPNGSRKDFGYKVIASGFSGIKQFNLEVSCKRSSEGFNCFESPWTTKTFPQGGGSYQFEFDYLGDNQCQVNKAEDCTKSLSDCPCTSSGTACINSIGSGQWSGRIPDNKKCVTYCGNGIKESSYESCSNCPIDFGQCNLYVGCVSGNECEGGFCIHEVCWDKPWRAGDGFCDINKEESCKNSDDCACKNNELCSNTGICEKPETSKKEVTEAIKTGVEENLITTKNRQKTISMTSIGLILLVVAGYLFYKMKNEKKNSSSKKVVKENNKKARVSELKKKIKERKKHLKKLEKEHKKYTKKEK